MAYGNYSFYDSENAAEQQKRAARESAMQEEMERRRLEQQAYDRQRQAFQEQIISQEQIRKGADTNNQFQLGLDANNVKRDLSKDSNRTQLAISNNMMSGMERMFGGNQGTNGRIDLYDNNGGRIGGSFSTFKKSLLG